MDVRWREITSQRNSFAALYAACELHGYHLVSSSIPGGDVTLYSLNSIQAPGYLDEISDASCITVVGGPHATACYEELVDVADYVVVGEGEFTVPRLLDRIEHGLSPPPGVATRDGLVQVDHSVLLDAYPSFSEYKGYIEISRGCPYACQYCQTPCIFGHRMRHRSLDSIRELAKHFKQIRLVTPNALAYGSDGRHLELGKVERLMKILKNDGDRELYFGTFPSEVRPEWITEESVELIRTFCDNKKLHMGVQSGSDAVLSRLCRGHSCADALSALDHIRDGGLVPVVDVIFGFPDETDEEQEETVSLVREVCKSGFVHAHRFIPLPGTPLAGTRSTPVIPEAEVALGSLALAGKVTGSWNDPELRFFRRVPY
ncbi:TIGR04013 family B12-binding domain/radical SAM domain-containing protein [Methanospirillum lacunae]|uniref:TIGR04013 family B12-binding domain/radical SAM domain-containing protein n=1 Tax=Methanospirillum lacunae TaxID=668570 RepID=A0A2V2NA68_9EURY|nr:TIGR04013 family B12-binding domain/radical SAM domain-containing protein [Methanospirillum lacunae]PWR73197.1 TIGR04013 family B12-binding domain/radical SAM domain-containing protein [Methanospirillum lacunae]